MIWGANLFHFCDDHPFPDTTNKHFRNKKHQQTWSNIEVSSTCLKVHLRSPQKLEYANPVEKWEILILSRRKHFWSYLAGAQPLPCCSFAHDLAGKMVIPKDHASSSRSAQHSSGLLWSHYTLQALYPPGKQVHIPFTSRHGMESIEMTGFSVRWDMDSCPGGYRWWKKSCTIMG